MQQLFDRSPVLPVDATISLARYLNSVRQTQRQAVASESDHDISRATLLYIRVLQLVCKTLPSHPDYSLPENAPVVHELRAVADLAFRHVERLANQLTGSSRKSRSSRRARRSLVISTSLPLLFERIAAERATSGDVMVGLLATRSDPSTPVDHDDVVSLIIPSQTHGSEWSFVRFERDVAHLLEIKELTAVGMIATLPRSRSPSLPLQAARPLAALQANFPNAVAVVLQPSWRDSGPYPTCFALSDKALPYVMSTDFESLQDTIPNGFEGEGDAVITTARHIDWSDEGAPIFKLYDVRPLREEQNRDGLDKTPPN